MQPGGQEGGGRLGVRIRGEGRERRRPKREKLSLWKGVSPHPLKKKLPTFLMFFSLLLNYKITIMLSKISQIKTITRFRLKENIKTNIDTENRLSVCNRHPLSFSFVLKFSDCILRWHFTCSSVPYIS